MVYVTIGSVTVIVCFA